MGDMVLSKVLSTFLYITNIHFKSLKEGMEAHIYRWPLFLSLLLKGITSSVSGLIPTHALANLDTEDFGTSQHQLSCFVWTHYSNSRI